MSIRKRRKENLTRECLDNLNKEDLIEQVLQLQAHNIQLRNVIQKQSQDEHQMSTNSERTSRKEKRPFDFSKHSKRHILLRILYLGWDYQGYATQEDSTSTIEHHLFAALTKSCLIKDRPSSNYHRCGRTDKGVSSFGQVISIDVRSKLSEDYSNNSDVREELPYCKMLNRLLPDEIRAVAWRPAPPSFSARFDCEQRTYKYYFPRGNLNIDAMHQAAQYVVGSHDFRNLCKMDVANGVTNYIREIRSIELNVAQQDCGNTLSEYSVMVLTIVGSAFLWHQIRCLVGVLLLVGQGFEQPEVLLQLLDINSQPRKPQYSMSSEVPLNLFHCKYPMDESGWLVEDEALAEVEHTLKKSWTFSSVKSAMVREMLSEICKMQAEGSHQAEPCSCLLQGVKSKIYKPLLTRPTCDSLEGRIEHYSKKLKLDPSSLSKEDENETNPCEKN